MHARACTHTGISYVIITIRKLIEPEFVDKLSKVNAYVHMHVHMYVYVYIYTHTHMLEALYIYIYI